MNANVYKVKVRWMCVFAHSTEMDSTALREERKLLERGGFKILELERTQAGPPDIS